MISAAPVGVGARTSAAWSISVVSVSWPTAETSGMPLSAAARTTASSLKPQRSSRLPPPRATISTSGRGMPAIGNALKPRMPAATSAGLVSPCTRTGQTSTCSGKRSAMRWMMSRMTAPVGEVTTPTTAGMKGRSCLRAGSKSPSAARRLRRSSSCASSAPTPAGSRLSMISWYLEEPGKVETLPVAITSSPSSGRVRMRPKTPFQITASIFAERSLRPK